MFNPDYVNFLVPVIYLIKHPIAFFKVYLPHACQLTSQGFTVNIGSGFKFLDFLIQPFNQFVVEMLIYPFIYGLRDYDFIHLIFCEYP